MCVVKRKPFRTVGVILKTAPLCARKPSSHKTLERITSKWYAHCASRVRNMAENVDFLERVFGDVGAQFASIVHDTYPYPLILSRARGSALNLSAATANVHDFRLSCMYHRCSILFSCIAALLTRRLTE